MLNISWNQAEEVWEVKDVNEKVLWSGKKYADAAQFAEDYAKQSGIQNGLQVGSARG